MSVLSIDFESRSTMDLRETGVYPYAAHLTTSVWCMGYAFDDEEPAVWVPTFQALCPTELFRPLEADEKWPQRIADHIASGGEIRAWNAQFERVIWHSVLVARFYMPPIPLEQWVCTAAEAAAMALPRSLDQCAKVLKLDQRKDAAGYDLMMRMSRPRKMVDGKPVWWDVPDRKARLYEYCKQDVRTERAIAKALHRLSAAEREVYLLDQRINDRGVMIDRPLVEAAIRVVDVGIERANSVLQEVTDNAVTSVTDHNGLKEWVNGSREGSGILSVSKACVRGLLEREDLPDRVRMALESRSEAGRSSTAKLAAMLNVAGADDRLRGLLLYHGASTGRWSGKLVQPQNFPRGDIPEVESFIPDVQNGDYELIDAFAPPIQVVSSMLRSMLIAAPGKEFVAADYNAIEARVLAWLAGQEDVLTLFARGEDVYRYNAARLYGVGLDSVTSEQRRTGKFQELACGYGMGAAKAVSAAKTLYELEISSEEAGRIVGEYRASHGRIVALWEHMDMAARQAVHAKNTIVSVAKGIDFMHAGGYLYMKLPSGRKLVYAAPRVIWAETPWGLEKPALEIAGMNNFTKQWERHTLWGGILVENAVQAIARDILVNGMFAVEKVGYQVVCTIHDELLSEVDEGKGDVQEFERLMCSLPAWAAGCPVKAEGWKGSRYRK